MIYVNDFEYIGKVDEFMKWMLFNFRFLQTSTLIYKKRAMFAMKKAINSTPGSQFVFMDIRIGE